VVFTAIHPDFFSDETPYLLTGVDLPDRKQFDREHCTSNDEYVHAPGL
jgi:hypothetical protein